MRRHVLLAILCSCALSMPALAQTPAAGTPAPTAVPATPPTPAAPEAGPAPGSVETAAPAKPKAKEVRATCRADAKSKGLKGDDMRKAVSDCVVAARPDLKVREQCRNDGYAKGLRKDELKAFVKDCAKGKK